MESCSVLWGLFWSQLELFSQHLEVCSHPKLSLGPRGRAQLVSPGDGISSAFLRSISLSCLGSFGANIHRYSPCSTLYLLQPSCLDQGCPLHVFCADLGPHPDAPDPARDLSNEQGLRMQLVVVSLSPIFHALCYRAERQCRKPAAASSWVTLLSKKKKKRLRKLEFRTH